MTEKILNHLKKMQVDGVHKYLIFYGSADNWNPRFYYHLLYHQDRRVMRIFILIIQHASNGF